MTNRVVFGESPASSVPADCLSTGAVIRDECSTLVRSENELPTALTMSDLRYIRARADDPQASRELHSALTFVAMHETEPDIVKGNFADLRSSRFLHCLSREGRKLPDGALVRFGDYPWKCDDEILVDWGRSLV